MITRIQNQLSDLLNRDILNKGHFSILDQILSDVEEGIAKGKLARDEVAKLNHKLDEDFLSNTMQGHALTKPYGYPGDFMIIDKIYTSHTSADPRYKFWDEYFHQHAAPDAVRNRKAYFCRLLKKRLSGEKSLNLLNVASGPARDLAELYTSLPDKTKLTTTCVEMDPRAIGYATKLNREHIGQLNFVNQNIFKYQTEVKFDLIWSAGLFDYFDDKAFALILGRMKNWICDEGEIVIGNFNDENNPSRTYMEVFGQWVLNHRSEDQLRSLARQVGFNDSQIHVGKEEKGVNLFLHLWKGNNTTRRSWVII